MDNVPENNELTDNEIFMSFLEPWLEKIEKKIEFLSELYANQHKDEALTLCCCYIEALGKYFYGPDNKRSRWCFVCVLKEFGANEILCYIHPMQLLNYLKRQKPYKEKLVMIEPLIEQIKSELHSEEAILDMLEPILAKQQLNHLSENIWNGSFAAIAYERIRSELVHEMDATDISFSQTTLEGEPVPNIDFQLLYKELQTVFSRLKKLSLETKTFMGRSVPKH